MQLHCRVHKGRKQLRQPRVRLQSGCILGWCLLEKLTISRMLQGW